MKNLGTEHENLDQKAYLIIKSMINDRRLAPGDKICQEKLASELGISRTPLISALKYLEKEKLVTGVDIGSRAIKVCQLMRIGDDYELLALGSAVIPPGSVEDGVVQEQEAVSKVLSDLFTNLKLKGSKVGISISGYSVIVKKIQLQENRFGFEPEITAKLSRLPDIRIYEVGISYYGRQFKEGKKINWKDGIKAIFCIIRYNLFK